MCNFLHDEQQATEIQLEFDFGWPPVCQLVPEFALAQFAFLAQKLQGQQPFLL